MLAGVILFSFVFKTSTIWVLIEYMLSGLLTVIDQEVQLLLEVKVTRGLSNHGIIVKKSLIGNSCLHKRIAKPVNLDKAIYKMFES